MPIPLARIIADCLHGRINEFSRSRPPKVISA
jgi:hypothetical protein